MQKINLPATVIALFLLGVSAPAMTACTQAQISGTWYVLVRWSAGDLDTGWNDCKLKLNKQGKVNGLSCVGLGLGETGPTSARTNSSGKVTLQKNCRITGRVGDTKVRGFVDRKVLVMNGTLHRPGAQNGIATFAGAKK